MVVKQEKREKEKKREKKNDVGDFIYCCWHVKMIISGKPLNFLRRLMPRHLIYITLLKPSIRIFLILNFSSSLPRKKKCFSPATSRQNLNRGNLYAFTCVRVRARVCTRTYAHTHTLKRKESALSRGFTTTTRF